mmetsp:Transcript_10149/g.14899  ORF Transcript_10149/g.14899 Transcript_10149/m.14899 type:complete len:161 (-) Transcript_10149:928-1410(-)|eukprot:CAMPEP_0194220656 /NCGR_PEP_ID=MMETSP0156-20130528/28916_1 /TAXON_ID=33649 /ORGANISM="Thalassionema nitzschioides, Strain L26-B" /LENGTH=160 /DNA_ID=CAMNT_0038950775 /DNA_START=20 /DNA_END=502 /DNA_ORIENTATION=+
METSAQTSISHQNDPKVGAGILLRTLRFAGEHSPRPKIGDTCWVHYEGFVWEDSDSNNGDLPLVEMKKFDSSRQRKQPLKLKLGEGHVMEGWEVALPNLKLNELAEVTIPHLYGYGEQGYPPKIPGKATLVFRMEIIKIESSTSSPSSLSWWRKVFKRVR